MLKLRDPALSVQRQAMQFSFLKRETSCVSRVVHPIDIRLFATEEVVFEADAFEQLFEFTDAARAVDEIRSSGTKFSAMRPPASIASS